MPKPANLHLFGEPPKRDADRRRAHSRLDPSSPFASRTQAEFAMRVALRYAHGPLPTVNDLAASIPLTKAALYRLRQSLAAARGIPGRTPAK
jgi:hypothetical protein